MQELITKIERREITVIKRPSIDTVMGGAFCYDDNTTEDEFLTKLANSLKMVERMGGIIPSDIEIVSDGNKFAATMKMGR